MLSNAAADSARESAQPPRAVMEKGAADAAFHFHQAERRDFEGFDNKEIREYLWKWYEVSLPHAVASRQRLPVPLDVAITTVPPDTRGLWACALPMNRFSYDEYFQPYQTDIFLRDFFADPAVSRELQVTNSSGWLAPLPKTTSAPSYEKLETNILSLAFFDRLQDAGITRQNGAIAKCLDTYLPSGDLVNDELNKCLLDPSAEDGKYADVFAEASDRRELIFRIFQALVLGGGLSQYEDEITPYLNVTKSLYKDLVSVQKRSATGELEVVSHAFSITSLNGGELFPCANIRNFCLVTVEPVRRWVTVWYHAAASYY